ncbi:MAG: type III pantothenate kinase [Alphaproteobacteria bacterium]|nr:type III pantothenate kinase [Alphaproteobacteria bacterium]
MLLAINANNTNVKFSVYDGDTERGAWRSATNIKRTGDEYAVWIIQLMALKGLAPRDIDAAIIATVVPEALFNLKVLCRTYFACEPQVFGEPNVIKGVEAKVQFPNEVGADRLINTLAAHHRYGGPAIVVDLGTATTFDVVDDDGNYRGGVISPGINLSMEALHMAAAMLPRVAVARPSRIIGTSTVECMKSGVFWGYVGLIEGLIERIKEEFGKPMKVIVTGGLAPLFEGATKKFDHVDSELTMHGLVLVHRLNSRT